MAIFYRWIKGVGPQNKSNAPEEKDLYTFIKFKDRSTDGQSITGKPRDLLPSIHLNTVNEGKDGTVDMGTIITSHAIGQYIDPDFTFNNILTVEGLLKAKDGIESGGDITFTSTSLSLKWGSSASLSYSNSRLTSNVNFYAPGLYTEYIESSDGEIDTLTAGTLDVTGDADVTGNLHVGASITCDGQIDAQTFNATSDKRAKIIGEPIKNALNLIQKTKVFNFVYKDSHMPSIGIMAQDVEDYDSGDPSFSLVNNKEATGFNGDYMTIKESKLVYITWSALQELISLISYQGEQINKLENKIQELIDRR